MQVRPDLAGFVDAQNRKRELIGEDITLLFPPSLDWPPGTPLDPQTGRPYDPMVEPVASAQASAVVRAGVAFRAVNRAGIGGETDVAALGYLDNSHIMLNLPLACAAVASGAQDFIAREERYKITATKEDGIGIVARVLVYGRRYG